MCERMHVCIYLLLVGWVIHPNEEKTKKQKTPRTPERREATPRKKFSQANVSGTLYHAPDTTKKRKETWNVFFLLFFVFQRIFSLVLVWKLQNESRYCCTLWHVVYDENSRQLFFIVGKTTCIYICHSLYVHIESLPTPNTESSGFWCLCRLSAQIMCASIGIFAQTNRQPYLHFKSMTNFPSNKEWTWFPWYICRLYAISIAEPMPLIVDHILGARARM